MEADKGGLLKKRKIYMTNKICLEATKTENKLVMEKPRKLHIHKST